MTVVLASFRGRNDCEHIRIASANQSTALLQSSTNSIDLVIIEALKSYASIELRPYQIC